MLRLKFVVYFTSKLLPTRSEDISVAYPTSKIARVAVIPDINTVALLLSHQATSGFPPYRGF